MSLFPRHVRIATPALLAFLLAVPLGRESFAQLPQIRLDRVYPTGGKAGSDVAIEIAGRDIEEARSLVFDHPGLKAEFVEGTKFKVSIAAGTPPGIYEVRAVGKHGISGSRLFAVTEGLDVAREAEPNDAPEQAQAVTVNSATDGESDEGGEDLYRVRAARGQRLVIEVQALRVDSPMRPIVAIRSEAGKELSRGVPRYRQTDPRIDFVAPADGAYLIQVRDLTYAGGHPYRLILSDLPRLDSVRPTSAAPGSEVQVTARGLNLSRGRPEVLWTANGPPLESIQTRLRAPDGPDVARLAMIDDLASPILDARVFQARPESPGPAPNPLTLALATSPIVAEVERNDSADSAQKLAMPAVVSGGFDRPGDVDYYEVAGTANEPIAVELLAERLGAPGDARVVVLDAEGKDAATFDDHGLDVRALSQSNRDPLGTFTPPADGVYRLLVEEAYGRGGPDFVYALRVGKPDPDFAPVAFHEAQQDPTCPVVRRGGSAFLEVCLNRRDGFSGPVTIEAEGLPTGVTCPPVHFGPQTETAAVVFTATADAPDWAGPIRLRARAKLGDREVVHPVRGAQRRWGTVNSPATRACREITLAVRPDAPYGLRLPSEPVRVAAGSSFALRVEATRGPAASKAPIQVSSWDPHPGFDVPATGLPADSAAVSLTVKVSPDVPPGLYTLVLRGDAQVTAPAEGAPPVRASDPATPLTVEVLTKTPEG